MAQTYADMEILLAIDGATDNSPQICDEYAARDNRFMVYRKNTNSGAGATRNYAINHASGEYIFFVDADDYWIDPRFVEKSAKLLADSHAEILSFSYAEFFQGCVAPLSVTPGKLDRASIVNKTAPDALRKLLKSPRSDFSSSIITKCVKASLLRDNNIKFIENTNGEDAHFSAMLIIHAKSYDRLNERTYAVRRHTASTSRAAENSLKVAESILTILNDLFSRFNLQDAQYRQVLDFLSSPYLYAMGKLAAAYDEQLRDKLVKYKFVLKYSTRVNVKLAGIIADIFGLNFLIFALRIYLTNSNKSHVKISKSAEEK